MKAGKTSTCRPLAFMLPCRFNHGGVCLYVGCVGLVMCVVDDICNVGSMRTVWNLINVWYVPSLVFLKQTETNEARSSNRKLQSNMFLSTAFVFRLSRVPVAALGGHSFDARAPPVANEFSFVCRAAKPQPYQHVARKCDRHWAFFLQSWSTQLHHDRFSSRVCVRGTLRCSMHARDQFACACRFDYAQKM